MFLLEDLFVSDLCGFRELRHQGILRLPWCLPFHVQQYEAINDGVLALRNPPGRRNEYFGIKDTDKNLSDDTMHAMEEKDLFANKTVPYGVVALTDEEKALDDLRTVSTLLPGFYESPLPRPPKAVNLTSYMDVMTFSEPVEYYQKYMDGEKDAYNRRCVLVGSKINIRANKMLDRFQTKSKRSFLVGCKVRVNLNAHKRSTSAARTYTVKDPKKWMAGHPPLVQGGVRHRQGDVHVRPPNVFCQGPGS